MKIQYVPSQGDHTFWGSLSSKHLITQYQLGVIQKIELRINVWFPSICHRQFGAGTEYCLRWRVRLARARSCVPSGSTLCSDSRILKTSKEILWVFFMLRLKLEFCQITSTWCKVNTRISKRVTEIIMLNVFYLFLQLNWQCLYVHQIAY